MDCEDEQVKRVRGWHPSRRAGEPRLALTGQETIFPRGGGCGHLDAGKPRAGAVRARRRPKLPSWEGAVGSRKLFEEDSTCAIEGERERGVALRTYVTLD